jgi:hypothetical protein
LTEEKLNLIENISNITFPKYHKNKKWRILGILFLKYLELIILYYEINC